ncbi:DUF433 domain-containing protein [Dyella flagellata]|uniref:DUF433 domain-containing protein n=1 Tax=Dyella flagellata TaxID=1867833 RepID=A0ABQ5XD48_9GAMM|nr:DUF433 domain-containing protein [Dyella flagellata]GLQ89407.1 hypothetical protein GCM10007898_29800 [Dyella flagellata]
MTTYPAAMNTLRRLKTAEAAFVAGVEIQDVNRAMDERILPAELFRVGERELSPIACLFLAVYYRTSELLTANVRRQIIDRMKALIPVPSVNEVTRELLEKNWTLAFEEITVSSDPVSVNLRRYVEDTIGHYDQLVDARDWVVSDPDILNGTPVIKGTRIPVYDVAASANTGYPMEEVLAAYPSLTKVDVERAALYAKTNPMRGRPREPIMPPVGARVRENRDVPYRKVKHSSARKRERDDEISH